MSEPELRKEREQEYGKDHPWDDFNGWHKLDHGICKIAWPCKQPLRCLWRYTRKTDLCLTQDNIRSSYGTLESRLTASEEARKLAEKNYTEAMLMVHAHEGHISRLESERNQLREEIRMLAEKADMLWHPDYEIEETVYDEYCNERDRILALAAVPEDESDVVESSYNEWFRMHQNDVAVPEERKTCQWTIFENTIRRVTYRTDCGLQYEWDKEDVKPIVCECGLPIVEKPGKEGDDGRKR